VGENHFVMINQKKKYLGLVGSYFILKKSKLNYLFDAKKSVTLYPKNTKNKPKIMEKI
jgi:hypothetical protein